MNDSADSNHVLIAEDQEADVYLLKRAIKKAQFQPTVSVVSDGDEIIKYLEKQGDFSESIEPKLILLDINMPIMNGLEVLKWLKANKDFRAIPVLMLTSSDEEGDIEACYAAGSAGYIRKPTSIHELKDIVIRIQDFWFKTVILPKKKSE